MEYHQLLGVHDRLLNLFMITLHISGCLLHLQPKDTSYHSNNEPIWYGTLILIKIITYHFIRNISSPLESVAPIIFSGSSPRSNPLGLLSSYKTEKLEFLQIQINKINKYIQCEYITMIFMTPKINVKWNIYHYK